MSHRGLLFYRETYNTNYKYLPILSTFAIEFVTETSLQS